ncbi:MAG: hypothetical protein OXR66_02100 [Candidatus Woesearchaeota archaeon]|nr:hypothetical protein [Candidatus Woesearchaeota archaeon]
MKLSHEDHMLLKKHIVKKLYANKAFRKGHLLKERLSSGIPPHLRGATDNVLRELEREKLVVLYGKTKYGPAYQLNIKKLQEIEKLIF